MQMTPKLIFALAILFLPLLSFAFQIFFGSRIGRKAHWVSIIALGLTLSLALSFFANIFITPGYALLDVNTVWFTTGNFSVELGFFIDNIAAVMLVVVSTISFLVHIYSTEYMRGDSRYTRYFGYLGLFTFSMNGIVLANNLIMMYVFWELVGISSYLLIGFWFEKQSAASAGMKAFLANRVGDIGMFIGIMLLFTHLGTLNLQSIAEKVEFGAFDGTGILLTIAGIMVFMGAIGKSAQFPLHIWLPDAMEGPTPVSALIHAATMVAAGVYMTVRIFVFLTPAALEFVAIIGGITALLAAIIAITQVDIKRVLAYSTVSQLGYMVMALGVGAYQAGIFHLTTHAMFKACLFLASGSVIHAMHHSLHKIGDHTTDPQDMRNMGGLRKKMPITYITMLVASLSISGIPFFTGFLSKDAILAGTLAYYHLHHGWTIFLPISGFGAALITAFYMFRLIFLTFHGEPARKDIHENMHETPSAMTTPLVVLSILSLAFVFTIPSTLNPFNSHGWFTQVISSGENFAGLEMETVGEAIHHAHVPAMLISLSVALLGILTAVLFYFFKVVNVEKLTKRVNKLGLYNLSFNKFYIDEIYDTILYRPFFWYTKMVAKFDWDLFDQKFIDWWGWLALKLSDWSGYSDYNWLDQKVVDGFGKATRFFGKELRLSQSGVIQNYILGGVIGLLSIFILFQAF